MSDPRLALLNAAYDSEDSRRNFEREVGDGLVEFDATEGELPDDHGWDGVVVTGSRASAYWEEDWIDGLRDWIREADRRGVPALGVCFGHQIVADALGGAVDDMGEYEFGYRRIDREAGSPLFEGIDGSFVAFESHHDEVTELPPGATLTAGNDRCVQGFQRGNAFGIQFHPEFDLETARRLTEDQDGIDEDRREEILSTLEVDSERAREAKAVFGNFRAIAAGRTPAEPADD